MDLVRKLLMSPMSRKKNANNSNKRLSMPVCTSQTSNVPFKSRKKDASPNQSSITISLHQSSSSLLSSGGSCQDLRYFGESLDSILARERGKVPQLVVVASQFICEKGLQQEGLFRISGNARSIENLKKEIEHSGEVVIAPDVEVVTVAGLLKMFFRQLPDSLIPQDTTEPFLRLITGTTPNERCYNEIRRLCGSLPVSNFETLKYLIQLLVIVARHESFNKMSPQALGIVFGPNIFRTSLRNQGTTNYIVTCFITGYNNIFQTNDEVFPTDGDETFHPNIMRHAPSRPTKQACDKHSLPKDKQKQQEPFVEKEKIVVADGGRSQPKSAHNRPLPQPPRHSPPHTRHRQHRDDLLTSAVLSQDSHEFLEGEIGRVILKNLFPAGLETCKLVSDDDDDGACGDDDDSCNKDGSDDISSGTTITQEIKSGRSEISIDSQKVQCSAVAETGNDDKPKPLDLLPAHNPLQNFRRTGGPRNRRPPSCYIIKRSSPDTSRKLLEIPVKSVTPDDEVVVDDEDASSPLDPIRLLIAAACSPQTGFGRKVKRKSKMESFRRDEEEAASDDSDVKNVIRPTMNGHDGKSKEGRRDALNPPNRRSSSSAADKLDAGFLTSRERRRGSTATEKRASDLFKQKIFLVRKMDGKEKLGRATERDAVTNNSSNAQFRINDSNDDKSDDDDKDEGGDDDDVESSGDYDEENEVKEEQGSESEEEILDLPAGERSQSSMKVATLTKLRRASSDIVRRHAGDDDDDDDDRLVLLSVKKSSESSDTTSGSKTREKSSGREGAGSQMLEVNPKAATSNESSVGNLSRSRGSVDANASGIPKTDSHQLNESSEKVVAEGRVAGESLMDGPTTVTESSGNVLTSERDAQTDVQVHTTNSKLNEILKYSSTESYATLEQQILDCTADLQRWKDELGVLEEDYAAKFKQKPSKIAKMLDKDMNFRESQIRRCRFQLKKLKNLCKGGVQLEENDPTVDLAVLPDPVVCSGDDDGTLTELGALANRIAQQHRESSSPHSSPKVHHTREASICSSEGGREPEGSVKDALFREGSRSVSPARNFRHHPNVDAHQGVGSVHLHGKQTDSDPTAGRLPSELQSRKDMIDSLEEELKQLRIADKRDFSISVMTKDDLMKEKVAMQKALLRFESAFGRPTLKSEKTLVKSIYSRYSAVKKLLKTYDETPTKTKSLTSIISTKMSPFAFLDSETFDDERRNRNAMGSECAGEKVREAFGGKKPSQRIYLDELSMNQLLVEKARISRERFELTNDIRSFEKEFKKVNAREMQKSDKLLMEKEYVRLKELKGQLRLVETVISKKLAEEENMN